MRHNKLSIAFLSVVLLTVLLGCAERFTSEEIIKKSIEAHGGLDAWNEISQIKYRKQAILYDSLGKIESDQTKLFTHTLNPSVKTQMHWSEGDNRLSAIYSVEKTIATYNDSVISLKQQLKKYETEMQGAFYVFWQPYKLLDPNAISTYQGISNWSNLGPVHVLEIRYPESNNVWWYYFDTETFKLLGNTVYHAPTYSYIQNTKNETKTGLSLNAERISYRVDSVGEIHFKRAEYFYEILDVSK